MQGQFRSLHIGINYTGTKNQLNGCVNDARNFAGCVNGMAKKAGFSDVKINLLTDETEPMPTKMNIARAMQWLVADAQPGDVLFISYSGHGTSVDDNDGDEADGKDEAIVAVDGIIRDDDIKRFLCGNTPEGVTIYAVFDACHTGTILDLALIWDEDNSQFVRDTYKTFTNPSVYFISGCLPSQTSADLPPGYKEDIKESVGALSNSLLRIIHKGYPWDALITEIRRDLRVSRLTQIPQFEVGHDREADAGSAAFRLLLPVEIQGAEPVRPPPGPVLPPVNNPRIAKLQSLPLGPYAAGAAIYVASVAREYMAARGMGACCDSVTAMICGDSGGTRGAGARGVASPEMFNSFAGQWTKLKFNPARLRFGLGALAGGGGGGDGGGGAGARERGIPDSGDDERKAWRKTRAPSAGAMSASSSSSANTSTYESSSDDSSSSSDASSASS